MRLGLTRERRVLVFTWLRLAFAVLLMGGALAYGLPAIVAGLAGLPDAIGRGDLVSGLGVTLMVTMWAALFSVGAGLWVRSRSARATIVPSGSVRSWSRAAWPSRSC